MSTDSEPHRSSFRFRDKYSRFKDRVKEKIRDKVARHNTTMIPHSNLTSDDDHLTTPRHGFRQRMHHIKDVMKNKTHYDSIKHKIKDKIDDKLDLHDNKTYPKGFYDSLFSPESENDVYLQTALICLWVIAVLCIIPTLIIVFLPSKKKARPTGSINMIFLHVFFCELCYLSYVLLAIINVWKDFRLTSSLCDFANYGMYVTIPIMQFALLFLSLERLSNRFKLSSTWSNIFSKSYLIQVILCTIWIFLIAALLTFMFIKKQFNFNFVKDQIRSLAPPILGDIATRLASRRHHCSIDGRLSSVFKTMIIILFIILIVKPIVLSIGFNLLTPFCCKSKRKKKDEHDDSRTTNLVTIFLLLNFFFSFPFYFTSMFKSILTNIDSTKDTFTIVLKICFILRITNIIFECLAFYIFQRNSWKLLRKLLYYLTCKKLTIFKSTSDDNDVPKAKKAKVLKAIEEIRNEREEKVPVTSKQKAKPMNESEEDEDEDEDGALVKKPKQKPKVKKKEVTPVESEEEEEEEEEEEKPVIEPTKKRSNKPLVKEETEKVGKKKSKPIKTETDDSDEEEKTVNTNRKSLVKQVDSIDDDDEEETKKNKRKSPPEDDDDEAREITTNKPRSKIEEEKEKFIPKPKSKSRHHDTNTHTPNGISTHKHPPSVSQKPVRLPTPPPVESEVDTVSNTSLSPKPIRKSSTSRPHSSSRTDKRTRPISPAASPSRHRTKSPSSAARSRPKSNHSPKNSRPHSSKKPKKKDHRARILDMSDDV